jgi:molybdopterin synthase catalytic subunit
VQAVKSKVPAVVDEQQRMSCRITNDPIDLQELSDFVVDPSAGALATFVGMTRNTNDGRQVILLQYECYAGMAEKEMAKIAVSALTRWPITKIAMVHRLGRVDIGEASVAIAVSSGHRQAAFAACQYAIDQLKATVPIWKKELYEGGELWIGSQTETAGAWLHTQEGRKR